jgi:hypothetical protein
VFAKNTILNRRTIHSIHSVLCCNRVEEEEEEQKELRVDTKQRKITKRHHDYSPRKSREITLR